MWIIEKHSSYLGERWKIVNHGREEAFYVETDEELAKKIVNSLNVGEAVLTLAREHWKEK